MTRQGTGQQPKCFRLTTYTRKLLILVMPAQLKQQTSPSCVCSHTDIKGHMPAAYCTVVQQPEKTLAACGIFFESGFCQFNCIRWKIKLDITELHWQPFKEYTSPFIILVTFSTQTNTTLRHLRS